MLPDKARPQMAIAASGTLDVSRSLDTSCIFDGMRHNFQHTNILAALREANEERRQVDERMTAIVAAAREYGISWQQIGQALEMSKQAAWGRFGWLDKRFSPGLSFLAVRGQLLSWRGRRVRVLIQSENGQVNDFRRQGRLDCAGVASSELITCWVGQNRGDQRFMLEPDSFRDAHMTDAGTLIVQLSGGQVEVIPLDQQGGE
jgi:hypothetical protein